MYYIHITSGKKPTGTSDTSWWTDINKKIKVTIVAVAAVLAIVLASFTGVYYTRIQTMGTIEQVASYDDGYGLYSMEIKYNYDIDRIIDRGLTDDQSIADAIRKEALPYIPIKIEAPKFACTAFSMTTTDDEHLMGRNYDFKNDTSAMLVKCSPRNGYSSVAFAALDNIQANDPTSLKTKMACLTAPFICLDGVNEKGVSIAVLTLDSKPTRQDDGDKQTIFTTLAIRLVLDRADSTEKAVELLSKYNMFATSGRDYHFYITDSTGDGRVVEYDCDSEARQMTVTSSDAVTNFFLMYKDKVLPNQKNDQYGHGRERYDTVMNIIDETRGTATAEDAWRALRETSQLPDPKDLTSNTQWSIVFSNTEKTATISIRMHWDDRFHYDLESGELKKVDQ